MFLRFNLPGKDEQMDVSMDVARSTMSKLLVTMVRFFRSAR